MKFKFGQIGETEFDREDAKIAIPLILLLLDMAVATFSKGRIFVTPIVYYLWLFFGREWIHRIMKKFTVWRHYRCPRCKSHETLFLGLKDYCGNRYTWYECNSCHRRLIEANERLLELKRAA
jgi:hypothetical protein